MPKHITDSRSSTTPLQGRCTFASGLMRFGRLSIQEFENVIEMEKHQKTSDRMIVVFFVFAKNEIYVVLIINI